MKFILLQQQLFQDEYSAVFYSILLRSSPSRESDTAIGAVATREANESRKRALEMKASQQKAKKRKVHTHFSREWECRRNNRKDKIAKYSN